MPICKACNSQNISVSVKGPSVIYGDSILTNTLYTCKDCYVTWEESKTVTENFSGGDISTVLFG
jgi:hypothetical protein